MDASAAKSERGMRADALRNRARILDAARDLFVEQGPDAPLDAIAARAGVGIATLYRRFPDREALIRAVLIEALRRAGEAAREAATDEAEPFAALASYMHRALDLRVSAVMPVLLDRVPASDEEIAATREASAERLEALIARAHDAGSLRSDVTFGDIGPLLVRLSRPLPGTLGDDLDRRLAHRHLDLVLDGLRAGAKLARPLPEPALTRADLRARSTSRHGRQANGRAD